MKRILAAIVIAVSLLQPLTAAAATKENTTVTYFDLVKDFAKKNYKFDTTDQALYESALKEILEQHPEMLETALSGMAKSMDQYTRYLPKDELSSWMDDIAGTFVGIGVTIEEQGGYVTVISPLEGSPAQKAGLLPGDRFATVDGADVKDKGVEYLRGLILGKEGTEVTVGILREGEADMLTFTIARAHVELSTVSSGVMDDNIGYVSISSFAETTFDDLKKALADFDEKKITRLIIDLRNNPGGQLNAVVNCLGLFVPAGPVVHVEYKDSTKNEVYYSENKQPGKYKLAVLVNEYSASGAEAFSGSIKDTKSGVIIGKTTFGKGTVQNIQPLATGGGLKITIATYTTANKTVINKVGVIPDYDVKNKKCTFEEHPDNIPMQYAQEINENSPKEAVEAVEQRLRMLSIYPGVQDGIIDDTLKQAITSFQQKNNLEVTGKIDLMTQVALSNATYSIEVTVDKQMEKALELVKK